jgi:hypothetical protein
VLNKIRGKQDLQAYHEPNSAVIPRYLRSIWSWCKRETWSRQSSNRNIKDAPITEEVMFTNVFLGIVCPATPREIESARGRTSKLRWTSVYGHRCFEYVHGIDKGRSTAFFARVYRIVTLDEAQVDGQARRSFRYHACELLFDGDPGFLYISEICTSKSRLHLCNRLRPNSPNSTPLAILIKSLLSYSPANFSP